MTLFGIASGMNFVPLTAGRTSMRARAMFRGSGSPIPPKSDGRSRSFTFTSIQCPAWEMSSAGCTTHGFATMAPTPPSASV